MGGEVLSVAVDIYLDFSARDPQPTCRVPAAYAVSSGDPKIDKCGLDFRAAGIGDKVNLYFHIVKAPDDKRVIRFVEGANATKYSYWDKEDKPTGKPKYPGGLGWSSLRYIKVDNQGVLRADYNNRYSVEYTVQYTIDRGQPIDLDPGIKNGGGSPPSADFNLLAFLRLLFADVWRILTTPFR